jgi:hypothetical protein
MEKQVLQHNDSLPAIRAGLTKRQIAAMAGQTVDQVLESESALPIAEGIAAMEEFAKQVRKDERFVDLLRDEIIRNNGKVQTQSGAKLEVTEAAVQYDYAQDASWRALTEEIEQLVELRKSLECKLRSIAPGKMWVDHETGEVLEGPAKASKSTYRITLSK